MKAFFNDEKPYLLILLAVYILLRIIYLCQYSQTPFWGDLTVDARFHYNWAQAIASGKLIGDDVFFRAPFYPYFLAIWHFLFSGNLMAIVIIQNLIGLASCIITYLLARKIFDRTTAQISAFLYIFIFDFVFFESELLLDFLLVFFLPLLFLILFKAIESKRKTLWLLAGIVLGMAAMTRPTVLILLVIVPIYMIINLHNNKLHSVIKPLAIFGAGLLLILLPVAVHNAAVGGQLNPIPTQGGINFYIGNNPEATGWSAAMPEPLGQFWQYVDCKHIAEKELGRKLSPREVSSYWMTRGFEFWKNNFKDAVSLTFKKTWLLISNRDISNNRNMIQFRSQIPISKVFFISIWLLVPLAVVGIIYKVDHDRKVALIVVFTLLYSGVIVLFFVTSRFRLPLLPFTVILAAAGVKHLWYLIHSHKIKTFITSLSAMILVFILTVYQPYKIDFSNPQQELYSRGNRLLTERKYAEARKIYQDLLRINPVYSQANMNIAVTFAKEGQLDSAAVYYEREIQLNPYSALSYSSLAEIERLRGNGMKSYELAVQALDLKPYFAEVLINYIKSAREVNRQDSALSRIESFADQYDTDPYYYFYRAVLKIDLAAQNNEYMQAAKQDLQKSVQLLSSVHQPTYQRDPVQYEMLYSESSRRELKAQAEVNLGLIEMRLKDFPQAYDHFSKSLAADSSLFKAKIGLIESALKQEQYELVLTDIDKILPLENNDQVVHILMYQAQANYGLNHPDKTRDILEEILRLNPDYEPAKRILQKIKQGD